MTVATTARSQQFVLDGVEDEFTFTFRALTSAPTDIKCIATTSGTDTLLAYTTDYTVAVNADGVGGTLTLVDPAAVGSGTLTVYRETTNLQESDYDDYNQFPANTLENDLDIRTLISQETAEANSRALTLPITVSGVSVELPTPEASKILAWNSSADALENVDNMTGPTGPTGATGATGTIEALSAIPANQDSSGVKVTLTANEAQAFGDVCYINASGYAALIDADAIATASGICMLVDSVVAPTGPGTYLLMGIVRNDSWTWTAGTLLYASTAGVTAGTITMTAPSGTDDVIQLLGVATHANRMFFNPSLVQVEHT